MLWVSLLLLTIVRHGQSFSPVTVPPTNSLGGHHLFSPFVHNTWKTSSSITTTTTSHNLYMTLSDDNDNNNNEKDDDDDDVVMDIADLAEDQIVEMVEVSFINACLQLSQGYVDVLKLMIVAVKASYENGTPPQTLVDKVAECPVNTAGRPLMPEEVQLRTTWIQAIYLLLNHIGHEGVAVVVPSSSSEDNNHNHNDNDNNNNNGATSSSSADIDIHMMDESVRHTYSAILPKLVDLRAENGEFQADQVVEQYQDILPTAITSPMEMAIVSQTIRVIWYTLVVLDEEKLVFGDEDDDDTPNTSSNAAPRPNIPYGESNNGSSSGGKGFGT